MHADPRSIDTEPMPAAAPAPAAEQARTRLLLAALKLFADHGFAKTSTREIAQAAGTNVAAIRYYFGDKAGLYRAAFTEPMGSAADDISAYDRPELGIRESLDVFMQCFLEPMKRGDLVQLCMRLHFREILEPTSVWQQEIEDGIRPAHTALCRILCRHLGLEAPDDEVHRLAFAIVALPVHLYVCRDIVHALNPRVLADEQAIALSAQRLGELALAMVEAEARRRGTAGPLPG